MLTVRPAPMIAEIETAGNAMTGCRTYPRTSRAVALCRELAATAEDRHPYTGQLVFRTDDATQDRIVAAARAAGLSVASID